MIHLKEDKEIKIMQEGGKILRQVVAELKKNVIQVGITTLEIDNQAQKLIKKFGGQISFNKVKDYYWATCLPINEEIVHSPPSKRVLKKGDVLTLDIGVYFRGFHTDFADTFVVGETKDKKIKRFLEVGKETLNQAMKKLKKGGRLGEVSEAIEQNITRHGYFVVKKLTGHGIGRSLHEDPYVFGYLARPIEQTELIKPGLAVAIEVIYSMGTEEMVYDRDHPWIIKTQDNSLSACFEHSLVVTDKDTVILT